MCAYSDVCVSDVCVCVYACIYVRMNVCMYACICFYACMYACMHVSISVCLSVCQYTCMYVYLHQCVCVSVCVFVCVTSIYIYRLRTRCWHRARVTLRLMLKHAIIMCLKEIRCETKKSPVDCRGKCNLLTRVSKESCNTMRVEIRCATRVSRHTCRVVMICVYSVMYVFTRTVYTRVV